MLYNVIKWAILAYIIQYLFKVLLVLDLHKRVYNHKPGPCRQINGPIYGSEDIDIIPSKNIAFITSGLVYLPDNSWNITWRGEIYKYDLSRREDSAKSVKIVGLEDENDFHPHGLSHFLLKNGTCRLFVVVHTKQFDHQIVLLDYNEQKNILQHVRTIRDSKFVRPNDITATGPDTFIISNDGGAQTQLMNTFEILSGLYAGSVVYYNGQHAKYLLDRTSANGISLANDRKTLFVSHILEETIGVYQWNENAQNITAISNLPTLTGCDNFHIDSHGLVWTGCHPVLKDGADHLKTPHDPNYVAPSQILVAKFSSDYQTAQLIELLADDGKFISASSIAASFDSNKQMLIGTVGRGLYHCDINIPIDFI